MQRFRFSFVALLMGLSSFPPSLPCQTKPVQRGIQNTTPAKSKAASPIGPYYALVIGNNDYHHLNKLQTAVHDADEVAQVLRERYGFETKVIHDATRTQIMDAFDDYRRLPVSSNLLLYYAGHGYKDRDAHRAYWLPVDAEKDHTSNWINATEITDGIRAIPSKHILVIADSCFAGDLTLRNPGAVLTRRERDAMLAKALNLKSRHIMSSGGDEPVADAGTGGHSVFAAALLQSLADMEDYAFTAEALLVERVKPRVAGRSAQTPQYTTIRDSDGDLGDFVFFRRDGAAGAANESGAAALLAEAKELYRHKEYEQALPLFRKASEAGQAEASGYLGKMYHYGEGGQSKNEVEAARFFRKAADGGDGDGMTALGYMYEYGLGGLAKDDSECLRWTRKAAEQNNPGGMNNLGGIYSDGDCGVAKDAALALQWYLKSADAGYLTAMTNIGRMYYSGAKGLAKNDRLAVRWFRRAAEGGDPAGMESLGFSYEVGLGGLSKDASMAVAWYRKGAEAGDPLAMFQLGRMYEKGKGGLEKDPALSIIWYQKAAALGESSAQAALKRLGH